LREFAFFGERIGLLHSYTPASLNETARAARLAASCWKSGRRGPLPVGLLGYRIGPMSRRLASLRAADGAVFPAPAPFYLVNIHAEKVGRL